MLLKRVVSGFLSSALLITGAITHAEVLFSDNFENERVTGPNPVFSWKSAYNGSSNTGAMYGPGDIFERSTTEKIEGNYSLRLNFNGRHNWCNQCNRSNYSVASGLSKDNYLTLSGVSNMSTVFNSNNLSSYRVYNKGNWFAMSQPSAVSSSKVDFSSTTTNMGGDGLFSAGDDVTVSQACSSGQRRPDCDIVINYLNGIQASHFPYGGTLARRMYIYIPSETVMPSTTLKLGYATLSSGNTWMLISVQRNSSLAVNNNNSLGGYTESGIDLKRNTWYYIEEVWKRESSAGASDGRYEMYAGEAFNVTASTPPVILKTGVTVGALEKLSMVGNMQTSRDSNGFVYIDAVQVSQSRIGPVFNLNDPPPESPSNLTVTSN